ncbi:MAG: hydrogenase maturation nickel metallochaperone HypA [Bacteroidales bacterium]|nr:hydrogenase maturation nickel metallochaperone HypA [Bacteroidales bacterium]MCF8457672.1 hydrogenase maturation nickel metallochaperone HypA [Bacteroidales bacterium]
MHEFSIIENIFKTIEEVAKKEKLTKITKVSLVIGGLRQIVPDVFEFAFQITSKDTLVEGAVLEIEKIPIEVRCEICSEISQVEDHIFFCRHCQSTQVDIVKGKELYIKSLDGE